MDKTSWGIELLTVLVFFLAGCGPGNVVPSDDAKALISRGALVVDVRSKSEFDSGHLDGALHIPHSEIENNLSLFGDEKDREIVVYCRSGKRSGMAKTTLDKNGYTKVTNGGGYSSLK